MRQHNIRSIAAKMSAGSELPPASDCNGFAAASPARAFLLRKRPAPCAALHAFVSPRSGLSREMQDPSTGSRIPPISERPSLLPRLHLGRSFERLRDRACQMRATRLSRRLSSGGQASDLFANVRTIRPTVQASGRRGGVATLH